MSFEGPEKRLDVQFAPSPHPGPPPTPPPTLRSLTLPAIDALLAHAACTRLTTISSAAADAHLLSESSLFVFPARFLIKTCGTTTLLDILQPLVAAAAALGLAPVALRYSRGTFLFPQRQPETYRRWDAEARYLDAVLGPRRAGVATRVAGVHLYVAEWAGGAPPDAPCLEVCMFGLDAAVMAGFSGNCREGPDGDNPPSATTARTGVLDLLEEGTTVDAFDFAPCGYSMNGLVERGTGAPPQYYTIHISPEPEASYVSFETSLASPSALPPVVAAAVALFKPHRFTATLVGAPDHCHPDWMLLRRKLASHFCALAPPVSVAITPRCRAASVQFETGVDDSLFQASPTPFGAPNAHLALGMSAVARDVCAHYGARVITSGQIEYVEGGVAPVGESLGSSRLSPDVSASSSSLSSYSDDPGGRLVCEVLPGKVDAPPRVDVVEHVHSVAVLEALRELQSPLDRPVFVIDLAMIERRIAAARYTLGPAVALRYAVHCNADPAVISLLNRHRVEFEAASPAEVSLLHSAGVLAQHIVFVSRILRPDTVAALGSRVRSVAVFGRSAAEHTSNWLLPLLAQNRVALEVRVAIHRADDALKTVAAATAAAVRVDSLGLDLPPDAPCLPSSSLATLLTEGLSTVNDVLASVEDGKTETMSVSIGEQYPGARDGRTDLFEESFIVDLVGDLPRVTVDAGRYIVGPSVTLVTSVIGRRRRRSVTGEAEDQKQQSFNYYLDDGVYGAFSCVVMEQNGGSLTAPSIFKRNTENRLVLSDSGGMSSQEATLFGPTCDALDRIWTGPVPELSVTDLVAFSGRGAYAASAISQFNGLAGQFYTKYVSTKPVHYFTAQF